MKHNLMVPAMALGLLAACGGGETASDDALLTDTAGMMGDAAAPAPADAMGGGVTATAELQDASGQVVGTATFTEAAGGVQIAVQVNGIEPGTHGIHIHETGTCTAPDFTSAGAHFNPTGQQHGLENPQGPHAGDMQNLEVAADGSATATFTNERISLGAGENSLFDADGSALVIHATADDQVTDPSGNSGDRIACGVVTSG